MNISTPNGSCGGCSARYACSRDELESAEVPATVIGDECWDNHGHIVRVFQRHDRVKLNVRHDADTIYCGSAESTLYSGVRDFVELNNFELEV